MFWTHDCESSSKIRIVGTTCRHKPIGSLNERNKNFVFRCFFSHWSVYDYADKVSNPQTPYSTKRHISQQRAFVFGIFMDFYLELCNKVRTNIHSIKYEASSKDKSKSVCENVNLLSTGFSRKAKIKLNKSLILFYFAVMSH